MSNSSRRLSRGDRRRNDRLVRLRAVVTRQTAVLAFDLAADKQVCALADQDSRVLARRTVTAKAWQLAETVQWGLAQAAAAGFSSVVVACEPTGHRWRVLDQIAEQAGVRLVCVQPLLVHRARESEDFTRNKSDETDAVIIARLVTELRCYLPARADPGWARLRHLGARRAGLVTDTIAARQQVTDLLECAWPAALQAAGKPMTSKSWLAAMTVLLDRVGTSGDLGVIRRWGWSRFAAAVRRELPRHGTTRWYSTIVRAVFDAATDPALAAAGVADQRAGARWAPHDLVEERAQVGPADVVRVVTWRSRRPAVTTQVGHKDVVPLGQRREHTLVALPALHLAGDQQQRLTVPRALDVVQRDLADRCLLLAKAPRNTGDHGPGHRTHPFTTTPRRYSEAPIEGHQRPPLDVRLQMAELGLRAPQVHCRRRTPRVPEECVIRLTSGLVAKVRLLLMIIRAPG